MPIVPLRATLVAFLLASAAFALSSAMPVASAQCTLSIGSTCLPGGSCTILIEAECEGGCDVAIESYCSAGGKCTVSAFDECESPGCTVDVKGICGTDGDNGCFVNLGVCWEGTCTVNVGTCGDPTDACYSAPSPPECDAQCTVNIDWCRMQGNCEVNVGVCEAGGSCEINLAESDCAGACEVNVGPCYAADTCTVKAIIECI